MTLPFTNTTNGMYLVPTGFLLHRANEVTSRSEHILISIPAGDGHAVVDKFI